MLPRSSKQLDEKGLTCFLNNTNNFKYCKSSICKAPTTYLYIVISKTKSYLVLDSFLDKTIRDYICPASVIFIYEKKVSKYLL